MQGLVSNLFFFFSFFFFLKSGAIKGLLFKALRRKWREEGYLLVQKKWKCGLRSDWLLLQSWVGTRKFWEVAMESGWGKQTEYYPGFSLPEGMPLSSWLKGRGLGQQKRKTPSKITRHQNVSLSLLAFIYTSPSCPAKNGEHSVLQPCSVWVALVWGSSARTFHQGHWPVFSILWFSHCSLQSWLRDPTDNN